MECRQHKSPKPDIMLIVICFFAGLGTVLGSECQTQHGGECHHVQEGCPGNFTSFTFDYCGFLSQCCYNTHGTLPSHGSCGISAVNDNHRVVGGILASPGEYPWQVSLINDGGHTCGGTLIDSQHVLTAAHCFPNDTGVPADWTVGVGTTDLNHMIGSHVRSVASIYVHEKFNRELDHNDIAIMKLSSPLDLSGPRVRAACLPQIGESFDGLTCTQTGWGNTYQGGKLPRLLREVDLPIISNDMCSYYTGPKASVYSSQICAGGLGEDKGPCEGDSGGPLVCHKDGVWKVAGIVSWGNDCSKAYYPSVYTRVTSFVDWINHAIPL